MTTSTTLQNIVATLLEVEPAAVQPELTFAGTRLQGSLARTRLYTAINQQLGIACQAAYTARTYDELHTALYGAGPGSPDHRTTAALVVPGPPGQRHAEQRHGTQPGVACGIDIEMVTNLPVVADYWNEAFYSATFTPQEIAYCLLQEQPLIHFAARWCAKEALKKCDPTYLPADLRTLEVAVSPGGAPSLCLVAEGHSTPLPFAVSLSHTSQVAVAVVVQMPTTTPADSALTPATGPTSPAPAAAVARAAPPDHRAWWPWFLSSGALGLALWALARTW
ncbi:MAG: 4'-phosphopantetheinyl transferase superfamily protein [Candidatus Tectimicrobiota bacterium]